MVQPLDGRIHSEFAKVDDGGAAEAEVNVPEKKSSQREDVNEGGKVGITRFLQKMLMVVGKAKPAQV